MIQKIYTIEEVADYLKVHTKTIRKLIDCEALQNPQHWFYVGRQIRIKESALKLITGEKP